MLFDTFESFNYHLQELIQNLIPENLKAGSALVQILLTVCLRSTKEFIITSKWRTKSDKSENILY